MTFAVSFRNIYMSRPRAFFLIPGSMFAWSNVFLISVFVTLSCHSIPTTFMRLLLTNL